MERQNEPLVQKKPWEEMTEEERQAVRESWKHTLPEEYDVFFVGHFESDEKHLIIPGNVYTTNIFLANHITIQGNFIADDYVECGDLTVKGSCIAKDKIDCLIVNVSDLLDCYDIQSWEKEIHASDYICRICEEES